MASSSSSSRSSTFPAVSLKALLLVSSLLGAMTAAFPAVATAQIVQLTVLNHMSTQPLKVANASPVPGSTGSITVMPGGTGFLALNAADPAAVLLFNVGPDTYVLVSDNDLDRVFRDTRAAAGVTMTVSGPPCVGGQGGLQTVTAVLEDSVAKCAEMDM